MLSVLDEAGISACVIGALAVHRWGEPRATSDADFSALVPYGNERLALDTLLRRFKARRPDARAFALADRVLLLTTDAGIDLDVALASSLFEIEALELASSWEIVPAVTLRTCSAEHLIVYKLIAARPRDIVDVDGIVRTQGDRLNIDGIRRWGREFAELKEDPDLLRPFELALRHTRA